MKANSSGDTLFKAIAIASGTLALGATYAGLALPLGFYALPLPTLLAARAWERRGGLGAALALVATSAPALFLWPDWVAHGASAYLLTVACGWLAGRLVADARREGEATEAVPSLRQMSDHLSVAVNAPAVWDAALPHLVAAAHADAGAWVWSQPQPLISPAGTLELQDEIWRALAAGEGPSHPDLQGELTARRDLFVAPIRVESWKGELVLVRAHRSFTSEEQERVRTMLEVARQAVLGQVRYARADEVLERKLQEMETLQNLGQLISESLDLDATLNAVLEALEQLIPYDVAEITYWDPEEEMLLRGALHGKEEAKSFVRWVSGRYVVDDELSLTGWLAEHREPLLIEDMEEFTENNPIDVPSSALRAYLGIPLLTRGELMGTLELGTFKPYRFSAHDQELVESLGDQAAIAIEKALLYEQMQERVEMLESRAEQMASMVSVATTLGSSLDLDVVLESIAEAVAKVLRCQRTAIFEYDDVERVLNMVAGVGVSDAYFASSQGVPVIEGGRAHALAANRVVTAEDVLEESAAADIAPMADEEGFRAFIDLPLRRGEQALGMLSVQYTEPHHFSEDELDVLRVLAEQATVAIENARLYEETDEELRRRMRSMELLQRMLQEITSTLDLDRILQSVLREAVQFSGAEAGMVALHEDGALHLQAMEGYDEGRREGLVEMAQRSHQYDFLVDFIERPQPHYFPDLSEGQGWWTPLDARSVFMAPVIYEGEPAAILLIQSEHPDAFPEAVQEFVEGLATQTAVAVGNARQYAAQLERSEWVQRRVEQMRLLLEMTRTMRSDRPLEEVLQDMAYATQEAVGYGIVLISIRQGEVAQRIAGAGMTMTELERLKQSPTPWVRIETIMQERFRIGQSYYIPAEHQEVWRSNDIDAYEMPHEDVERVPGRWHPQDVLLVPLYNMQGKVLGYMSVDAPESGAVPNRNTLEVLELFAAQLALAIENSELVDHLRLQLNTVTLFNELNRSITSKLDLSMVLNTVVQAVTNLLDYDYSTIFLQDRATQRFVPQASSGYDLEMLGDLSFAPAGGLIGSVVKTSMPLVSEDVQNDPRFVPGPIPIGSSILVPLITEGHTIGVLAADRKGKGDFSPREVATLTALADQVSVAVENARLFEEVTHFSEELEERVAERTEELGEALESLRVERDRTEVLYRIASELVASLDLDQVLYKTLALLRNTVGAQRGSILVFDPQREALMQRASIGEPAMPPGGRPVPFEWQSSLAGWVVEEGRSAIVDDAREDERWLQREGKESTRSVLAVPIPGGAGEVHGAILLHSNEINAFDEAHRRLVEAAGVQLGNAINNAELYRLIREQAERLGAMLRTQQVEAAKSEAILEAIADGVMVTDAQGRVILFNAAAEIILSIHREEALGRVMDEMLGLYGSEARDWLTQVRQWREIPTSYESGAYLAAEFEMGRQVVSVHLAPVISAGDEFLGTVSIFRDITAEVEADRAKTEFVSTVSHELRTPMTSIKGYTDLLLMGTSGDLNDMQRHFLGVIKVNADRLSGLVNDLLDLSRMETGKVELAPEPIDVGALVEQVALTIKPEAAEKGLSIYAVVPEGLPHAYGDPARVTQILTNLVNNAYKYTPSGGEISVHAYVKDAKLHVAVADTGIGISADNQRKIFDRFFRVDDPLVQEVSGTGLGLAITLTLIHMHGGELLVESELGEGSIFTFNLPLAEGEPTAEVGKPPADYALTPPATVLVVEDDLEVAELLRLTLENEGRRVLLAPTGKDALRMAREEGPDVISLDILLPDMNGFQVLERLKEDEATANIPVIVVSAVTEAQRGLDLGAVAYLPKPVDIGQITEVVNANLVSEGTVLVVDDDPGVLTLLREALRAQGLGVRTTGQGKRGLHLAQDIQPALVLLDLKLPDMDGYDVLRQLKGSRRTADIPVIVMTGMMPSPTTSEEVKRAGALKYLTKPLSVVELAEEISHLVDGQNGNKE